MSEKTQYFNGYRFTRGKEGTYYRCAKLKKRMHIYVWEYYNGKIPSGYEVHHIDFDKSNNDISNLQLLSRAEHKKLHADLLTEEQREWRRNNINEKARPKAIEWHKSDAGKNWHSRHIAEQHKNGAFNKNLICTNCGKEYVGRSHGKNTFCCNACKSAYRRKMRLDDIEVACSVCGKKFMTNKYRPRTVCKNCGER